MYATASKNSASKTAGHTPTHSRKPASEQIQTLANGSVTTLPGGGAALHVPSSQNQLSRIIQTARIQPKLRVGKSDDRYEQEADQTADKVMRFPAPPLLQRQIEEEEEPVQALALQRQPEEEEEPVQALALQRQAEEEEEEVQALSLQRQVEEEEEEVQALALQRQAEEEEEEAQALALQRQPEEEEEPVQAQSAILRKAKEKAGIKYVVNVNEPKQEPREIVQTRPNVFKRISRKAHSLMSRFRSPSSAPSTGSGSMGSNFESTLTSSKGAGFAMPEGTRTFMESRFGADFSGIRLHTGPQAVQMNEQINAQAFTHKNDIYFNAGKYNPHTSAGQHLLAHELTHTIQQGAAVHPSSARTTVQKHSASRGSDTTIQRSWLGDAWDSVSGAVSGAVDFVADSLEAGLDWIKDQFRDFVREIPGYRLLAVVLGQDPVSGAPVARSGRNFIEAGLDIIPFGNLFKRKLEETGALEEAATWLDEQIAGLDISLSGILSELSDFWDSLSLSDIGSPRSVLNRAANIIRRPVGRIITFAGNVATAFLRIVKNYVITELATFVRDNTRGYPLLTVILGQDPITEAPVERNGMNLIRGFMLLSEEGEEQLRQMQETGSLQRAADWIDGAVARLDLSLETIRNIFTQAWNLISIENLMRPLETFQRLVGLFAAPVGRIIRFVVEVGLKILEFIKDALLSRLSAYARNTRGYPLITVILGKDPFTEAPVERNAENIIHGFMSLMEGGEEQFQQMKESGAIQRTTAWIEGAVEQLGFTWAYITGLFITAWESFSLRDLAAPFEAFARIIGLFADPIRRLFAFIWEVIKKVIEILLIIMRFPINLVNNIITRAMEAIEDIKRDPVGFIKNLLRAIKQGFSRFFDNILTHLLQGLTNWLFSELEDAGIRPPQDLSLGSIFGFVLEVLGITMERIWQKLGERIGQERVARIRGMIDRLTGIWTFVKDVMTRGPIAIWEYIVERISNLWDMVLEHVRNWVMTRIVERVTARLLSMLDPTGIMAVVNSVIALYNAIQSFIRYITEMLEIVNSFVEGVAEIARGSLNRAAEFLENSLARAMPVAIGFLANQVGLSGLGRRIGEMIEAVRERVDRALDWLIDRAVSAGTSFMNMLRGGASPEEMEQDDSPEGKKQRAAREVEQAMQGGIRRSALVNLLRDVKTRYQLRDASLNSQDDVVLENSPPTLVRGQRQVTALDTSTPSAPSSQGQQAPASPNQISVGSFSYAADTVQTIGGVLSGHISPGRWPLSNMANDTARPQSVEVTLNGALGSGLTTADRDSANTRLVGYFGNWESGLRRGNRSWRQGTYDGGHILGHQFGGDESFENLVPQQNWFLNRQGGMYASMENFIRSNLTEQSASQMTQVQDPELHFVARFTYPGPAQGELWRVARVAASAFYATGGGQNAYDDFMNSLPPEGQDPSGIRDRRVSVPARVPTRISADVTLRGLVTPFNPANFQGRQTQGGRTIVTGDVSDPLIVPQDSPVRGTTPNTAQSGAGAPPAQPQPQHWRRVFSFTQSNRA